MGKGGTILGIIGLLIGAGGLGMGLINWTAQSQVRIWNDYEPNYFTAPDLSFETIPNLYVIVDLSSPVQLYVTFSASTKILPSPGNFADILFYFMVDGTRLLNPYTRVGPYDGTSTYEYLSVCLQYFNALFPAGRHNISIAYFSETGGNVIRECLLTAQSYPV
jgi:hypothetical protein